jgi:hypothetical protein
MTDVLEQEAQSATGKAEAKNDLTLEDLIEAGKETIPLGGMLYLAAKDVVAISPFGVMPKPNSLSPTNKNHRAIMLYTLSLVLRAQGLEFKPKDANLLDEFLPEFARSFLIKFPTLKSALKKYDRLIPISDFFSPDQHAIIEQVLSLTIPEAKTLINAKPLVMEFKDQLLARNTQLNHKHGKVQNDLPSKPKQKGRYRLKPSEIKFRKQRVKDANQMKKDNPQKQWKEIDKIFADELNISDRTFRDWRHTHY